MRESCVWGAGTVDLLGLDESNYRHEQGESVLPACIAKEDRGNKYRTQQGGYDQTHM